MEKISSVKNMWIYGDRSLPNHLQAIELVSAAVDKYCPQVLEEAATIWYSTPEPTVNTTEPISDNPVIQRSQAIVRLRKECRKQGLNLQQTAYVCATAEHESANTFKAIREYGDDNYFTQMYEGRSDLGNTESGDGIKFCGRGLVQLTGRTNYTKYSVILGINLVENPDKVLDENISQFIIIHGMAHGIFTGMRLDDYINNHAYDYYNARRIINGLDRAEDIRAIAYEWEKFITENPITQEITNA